MLHWRLPLRVYLGASEPLRWPGKAKTGETAASAANVARVERSETREDTGVENGARISLRSIRATARLLNPLNSDAVPA
jgi:hypothetical protein